MGYNCSGDAGNKIEQSILMVVVKGFLFVHVTNSDDGSILRSMLPDIQAAGIVSKIFMPVGSAILHMTTI